MRDNEQIRGLNCKNCGAPVTTEICPFCGSATGLVTAQADMNYPVLECKEATLSFFTVIFPAIFAFSFGFFGFAFPFLFRAYGGEEFLEVFLICIPFAAIGIAAFVIMLKPLIRYAMVKFKGTQITATVYGYMDDNLLINGVPAQVVKLLVNTPEGYRFILYQLGDTKQPYGVNSQVNLMVYKYYFLIDPKERENRYIKWN
ncbi:MAG: hypothetical protein IK081_13855 [Lachnospiraceae bacterium]|nr:hypothetical protein [Lachnospiraceae bacterium]